MPNKSSGKLEIKEYDIISENSKWYAGQFYCNKILDSSERAQEYYEKHKISWRDLNIQAHIEHKNPEDDNWKPQIEVYVKRVAEGNNYKEFHIEYKTVPDKDVLGIKKGTKVKLTYTYDVPLTIWGTYLNRYLTYWREVSAVTILCQDRQKLDVATFKLYEANENGDPVLVQGVEWSPTYKQQAGDLFARTIIIPTKRICCRYTAWWDATVFFGDSVENTKMTSDELQLTNR